MSRHWSLAELDWQDIGKGWTRARVELAEGDSAVNPASTKEENVLRGPMVVEYDRSRSGISVYINPEDSNT
jgi:hypothetical protein